MKYDSIGIVGGFGAFATLDFLSRLLVRYRSDCERNYPRIVMDNNFKMPSRTKCLLSGEGHEEIIEAMVHSMRMMLRENVEKIILLCGTAHCFIEEVFRIVPEARPRLIHMVDALGSELQLANVHAVTVLAAEGTLSENLYGLRLAKFQIECMSPTERLYPTLRFFIESVKQCNNVDEDLLWEMIKFLDLFPNPDVILGCTELPIIIRQLRKHPEYSKEIQRYRFWDPLESIINLLE